MREIKFRAWDKDLKAFYYSDSPNADFVFGSKGSGVYMNGGLVLDLMDENTNQYTGLKDKHGVEIYEGDIVAWETGNEPGVQDCKMAVEIRVGKLGVLQSLPAINATSEVIGNIYENPELLK